MRLWHGADRQRHRRNRRRHRRAGPSGHRPRPCRACRTHAAASGVPRWADDAPGVVCRRRRGAYWRARRESPSIKVCAGSGGPPPPRGRAGSGGTRPAAPRGGIAARRSTATRRRRPGTASARGAGRVGSAVSCGRVRGSCAAKRAAAGRIGAARNEIESNRDVARLQLEESIRELLNLVDTALLVVRSARRRRESRGLHENVDRPCRNNEQFLRDTVPCAEGRQEAQGR